MSSSLPSGRRRPAAVARAAAVGLTAAFALISPAAPASAATSTIYASPSGGGSACTAAQPCSLAGAQAAVRSLTGSMSGDVIVQLADGVYRQTAPLRFTSADSGTNGHNVIWQAAPGAHPVITGAKAVTGWSVADSSKNIWKASVGTGIDTRQLYVDGVEATRARTQVNRSDFTATGSGLRFGNSALGYLNNLANQNRVEVEVVNSFTDRYAPVQSISGNFLTMQQPAWNNNSFGYDTFASPFRAGPMYLENAYEFLDSPGEWYLDTGTGTLYYIPRSGQSMSSADVELPVVQSLVDVGGTYDAPAHNISFSGISFTGTSWLGPSSNQGYADQQTGAYISGNQSWPSFGSCNSGCTQFEAVRPHWSQMPAAVQVSAANNITFTGDQFVNLGQTAVGIGNDANAHASGVGLGAASITVTKSTFTGDAAGAIVAGGVQADAHHPSDSRMTNRDITISYNTVHDIGLDYRGISSFLPTYVTNATISHNEVYNMPYSGITVGYGWGANDAGGSNDYANRGLYNYQPRYSTATTASNYQITDNYVHDVMQQMNDGGCIYTLSANPNGRISGNYCLRTNGYFGLYFDEGSRYFTATNNVFSGIGGTWATMNANANNNTGTLTLTNNWYSNGGTNIVNGDRGNTVSGNVQVSNGSWPSGAQTVIANAGTQSGGGTSGSTGVLRGAASNRCLDVPNGAQTDGTYLQIWDCNGGAGQQWTLTSGGQLTVYGGAKCLDVPNHATAAGTRVEIWTCNGGTNQQWRLNSDGTVVGTESGLCLDVTGNGTANGTAVEIWTCNGGSNQKWTRS
ncbi:ricin-type beta-trefoil lectin domain protein [Actinoallomurus rhizosphaericola]|uniref:ricin-type beta-trefoil lectin domain protein n=1 Tax=Actinoallomurus rhizosphaericola TaxID=2952536 RepID=UPI0020937593|nr:ricin-type beta-trefoil lectin domain protein [Actinoallomurus rhizosphaericola]MCO5995629.1 RICIN domain-containing protein [Actinoallomurus rhizosphaericola]